MLEDSKQSYMSCADSTLPGWREMSKSELCELYINSEANSSIQQGAISAIIYNCWNIFWHNYRAQPYIPLEDWYDSMIEAIMYVLENHIWTNPDNILFNNPRGPEMALHRCIWSRKLNLYGANKKPKRIINLNIFSTDALKEKAGIDPACELDEDMYIFNQYIKTLVEKGKIEYGIILDLIATGTSLKKLAKEIRNLNSVYIKYFCTKYNADELEVENILNMLQNNRKLNQYIEYYITCLQRDEDTLDYLK